jgi:predicted helicase
MPIMVVIGNPPYSVSSSNKGEHIEELMDSYKEAVRDEQSIVALSDDYIKFIRFAHDRVERTGYGVIGMITNHSYLSGLIHRGMREELLKTFDEIYILNLHGNALMGETPPDGGKDENVFDIRQGVAIALMVKTGKDIGLATVRYADLWGRREHKYHVLSENRIETLAWQLLDPVAPYYFFVPKDFNRKDEYEEGWRVPDIFPEGITGIKTHRDRVVTAFEKSTLVKRFKDIADNDDEDELKRRYGINDTSYWTLSDARDHIILDTVEQMVKPYFYRVFDYRYIYYNKDIIERGDSRWAVMRHMLRKYLLKNPG